MSRSPIFVIIILFFLLSCKKQTANRITAKTENIKNRNTILARKLLELGELSYSNKKFDSAYYYYNHSKTIYELEKDSAAIVYNSIQIANIQQITGDYLGSEKILIESLPFILPNSPYESATYNLLGISSKQLFNFEDALYYYDKAKKITADSLGKLSIENNKATVYIQKKQYNKSITLLEPILKSPFLDTLPTKKARILDNLGYSYFKIHRTQKGHLLMSKALILRKENNDSYGSIKSNLHLAEYYLENNPKKAEKFAKSAYQTATVLHSVDERLESLTFLINNTIKNKHTNYARDYIQINDSILKVRNNVKNQFVKIKYDSDQNRSENLKLKAQKAENDLQLEREKNRSLTSYIITVLVLGFLFFLYYYLTTKGKREKTEAVYQSETRMSKKLHDELANDVYQTMAFAETQDLQNPVKKETLLGNLDKIYARTRNISRENSTIETGAKFEDELKGMVSGYNNNQVKIIIKDNGDINWMKIQREKKIAIYRVLQELLVNMKKHSQCSFVIMSFESNDKFIQINYSDNGIGVDQSLIFKNGLHNVENRIHLVNGSITFESEPRKGFKAKIGIPK